MAISDLPATDTQQASTLASSPIARLSDVSLRFPDGTRALDDFSLEIAPGECLGMLGPNGAGKTSLLRLLAGLLQPTAGAIELFGTPIRRDRIAVRRCIGYVAQQSGVDGYLSGEGNLLLAGRLHGLRSDQLRQRIQELLELLGLQECAGRRAAHYSGGQRRRLALACSLVHRPDLLLLDEPTTGLDTVGKATLWSYVLTLQQAGMTIVTTSHDTQEIERHCSRVVLMDHGRLVMAGTPTALKASIQGDLLTLELGHPQQVRQARRFLEQRALARSILQGDDQALLSLEVSDGSEAIPQIVRLLDAAGLDVRRITLSRPTLEDVFFRATGKSLADTEALSGGRLTSSTGHSQHNGPPFLRRNREGRRP